MHVGDLVVLIVIKSVVLLGRQQDGRTNWTTVLDSLKVQNVIKIQSVQVLQDVEDPGTEQTVSHVVSGMLPVISGIKKITVQACLMDMIVELMGCADMAVSA